MKLLIIYVSGMKEEYQNVTAFFLKTGSLDIYKIQQGTRVTYIEKYKVKEFALL